MPIALLETKLYVPRSRRGLVLRPRLSERLDRGTASKLVLVSAPAGFGKTTLLTEWLAARPAALGDERLAAWLSLDRGDNDPASFWAYVIAALRTVAPGVGESALSLLDAPQPPPIETVLTTLLNDLGAVTGEIVLVLDDYHVIDAREVQDGMAFLLDHLPPWLHVVIASRADPPLPLARMRARGELAEIRAAELRFTADEAAAYLNEMMGLQLTARDVATLEGRTEGWIAALQLAALSMQGRDDVAGFIAGFAGDDRYVVDYLAEEVLARQSDRVQTLPAADLHPGPAERSTMRCRHRAGRWQGHAGGAGSREPVPGLARRPPPVVSLPPSVCRRAAGAPAGRAARPGTGLAPAGERMVRAERRTVRGRPPRAGRRGFRASGRPGRAGDPGHAEDPAGGQTAWLA